MGRLRPILYWRQIAVLAVVASIGCVGLLVLTATALRLAMTEQRTAVMLVPDPPPEVSASNPRVSTPKPDEPPAPARSAPFSADAGPRTAMLMVPVDRAAGGEAGEETVGASPPAPAAAGEVAAERAAEEAASRSCTSATATPRPTS
jgi:hypothetical protein